VQAPLSHGSVGADRHNARVKRRRSLVVVASIVAMATGCGTDRPSPVVAVTQVSVARLASPWSLAFLPDGRMLVTERPGGQPSRSGKLHVVTQAGNVSAPLKGVPGNAGLLDVTLDPNYRSNRLVYGSFIERRPNAPRAGRFKDDPAGDPAGLAVFRGRLSGSRIVGAKVIWRQVPKIVSYPPSNGEEGGRMAFSPDGRYLFIAAGDREEFQPVQSLANTLGKIVRIFPDGTIPTDNPFATKAGARPDIWTSGQRNPYGLAFNAAGQLWEHEMGPKGGDEFNLIKPRLNYGWPNVSYGDNYVGPLITRPAYGDGYARAAAWWTPVIAPSGMIFYRGDLFSDWNGDAIITGLQWHGLVRVRVTFETATEVQRLPLGHRIRAIAEASDGALWVLEDAPSGRLLRLTPGA
jgi:glucose/arabinose dehydrogenase